MNKLFAYKIPLCDVAIITREFQGSLNFNQTSPHAISWYYLESVSVHLCILSILKSSHFFFTFKILNLQLFGSYIWESLVAQTVKCLPAKQDTWVRSLGQEDSLEKDMATHSSTIAWKIPWTEESGGLQSMGLQRVRQD